MSATETTERSHSEQQAAAQLASIKEMVRAMERETAAEDFANDLTLAQCNSILADGGSDIGDLPADITEGREMVRDGILDGSLEPDGFEFDEDEARQRIQEDALSVEVRKDWYTPGDEPEKPSEFQILLCTGGPAVRLLGDLNEHGKPDRVYMQHQDWGTPWTEFFTGGDDNAALLTYARQFVFGE